MDFNDKAMIALTVPDPELYAMPVQTDSTIPADDLHITLAYLGDSAQISEDEKAAILDACQTLADTSVAPESLFPASTGVFPPEPGVEDAEVPTYASPSNPEVFNSLREDLMTHLGARGVGHYVDQKHPVFTPHVTLAYSPLGERPDVSHLPTPLPTRFSTLRVSFGPEDHTFELNTPVEGAPLPLTASVRAQLARLALRTESSEDYLTALYLRQKSVQATPAQSRAQAALNNVHAMVDPHYRSKEFDRVKALAARVKLEADPAKKTFVANRALALAAKHTTATPVEARELAALTASLRTIIADGNSSVARSMRARQQLRDRYGRWIEQGGGVRFKVRVPGAPGGGTWYHGTVEGFDIPNGRVNVKLEDGRTVGIPNTKIEQPKAILGLRTKMADKVKSFRPKSANRSNPELEQPLRQADPATDELDQAAMDALDNIYEVSKGQATKDPGGGNLVRLAIDASNDPDYDPNEDSTYHTGTVAPFKGEDIQLSTADVNAVRAAYDNRVAKLNKPAEGASEEETKKALQKAQSGAIGYLAGLFNDKHDEDAVALRKAPSVGTDQELEEVDPDKASPQAELPGAMDMVDAVDDAFNKLFDLVPDEHPLSGARDKLNDAINGANSRYVSNEDDELTYLKNLDAIKEFANDQEPAFTSPNAKVDPVAQAFGAFAEDIDDIHAAAKGVDEIDAVRSALADVTSLTDDIDEEPGEYPEALSTDLVSAVYQIEKGIKDGKYLNNTDGLGQDIDDLLSEMTDMGLEDQAAFESLKAAREPFGDVPEAPTAPESVPDSAPETPEGPSSDWTPLTVDDIAKMNPQEAWTYDDGAGIAAPGVDVPLPDGNHAYITRSKLDENENWGKGGKLFVQIKPQPDMSPIDGAGFAYDESPYGSQNGKPTEKQAQQALADWINAKAAGSATEKKAEPNLDATEDYTDAPDDASDDEKQAFAKHQDVHGAAYDLMMGENGPIVANSPDTDTQIIELSDAMDEFEAGYMSASDEDRQAMVDNIYSAATNAAEAFGSDGNYDTDKIQALVDAATDLKATFGTPDDEEPFVPGATPGTGVNAPTLSDFTDLSKKFNDFLVPYQEEDLPLDAYDRAATAANTVENVGNDLAQGKIDSEDAVNLLANAVTDINDLLSDDDDLADSEFGMDLDSLMGEVSNLQGKLSTDGFNPESGDSELPAPVIPDNSTWDGLDSNQKAAIDDSANQMLNWLNAKNELLQSEPDFESGQGSDWEKPIQAIKDFTRLQDDYADASLAYADNELTHQEFADRLAEISNTWQNSDGFAQLAGMGDADGTMAEEFDTDYPLAAFIESLPGVIDPTQIAQTPVGNDDPWAEMPDAPGRTSPWTAPDSQIDKDQVAIVEEELAEWEKELLGYYDEVKNDVPLLEENAPEAVAPVQKLLNAVDDAMKSNEEPSEKWEDLLDAQNIFLDEFELLPEVSDDGAAVVEAVKEKVETLVEDLEANPIPDTDPQVEMSKLQGIIDSLNQQDGFIQKILANSLQEKLDNGEEISEGDLAQVQQFLGTIAESENTTPEEKADYKLAEDALDVETAVPAEAPEVPETAPEAPETLPEAPEAPATPAETPATLEESLAEWQTSLNEYLASPAYTGSSAEAAMVHGSVHNPLNQKQVENIQSMVDGYGPGGLSATDATKLQKALNAHLSGDISDDELIQAISSIGDNYAFFSKIAGRLRGAQSGIQVNKPALVGVLRPKDEYYGNPDDLDATDFYMASPEVVQGTLNKILEQSLAGADLEALLDSAAKGTDDAAVSQHIDNAKMFAQVALDALQSGNAEFMISNMRDALNEFDSAIALRAQTHKNDKVIRRLRARRRSLDEVLAAFEGRWPDPVVGGNKQEKHGGFIINNSHSMEDKDGNLVYPGDIIERTYGSAKGQLALTVATENVNGVPRALVQLDDHPDVYHNGLGNKSFVLSAVGPNNPLYSDPSYTGPKVDTSPGTFGDLTSIQKTYADNQAKKGKSAATANPTTPEEALTPELEPGVPAPVEPTPDTSAEPETVGTFSTGDTVEVYGPGMELQQGTIINFDSVGTPYASATVELDNGDLQLVLLDWLEEEKAKAGAQKEDQNARAAKFQDQIFNESQAVGLESIAQRVQVAGLDGLGVKGYNTTMKKLDEKYQLLTGGNSIADFLESGFTQPSSVDVSEDDSLQPPDGVDLRGTDPDGLVDRLKDLPEGTTITTPSYVSGQDYMEWTKTNGYWKSQYDTTSSEAFETEPWVILTGEVEPMPDDMGDDYEPFVFDAPTNVADIMALQDLDDVNVYEGLVDDAFDKDEITESQYNALKGLLNERRDQLNNPPSGGGGGTPPPDAPQAPTAPGGASVFQPLPADQKGQDGDMWVTVNGQHKWGRYGAAGVAVTHTDENGKQYVLLGKRGDRDEWYLPGGALDEGETPIQGATREFIEEATEGADIAEMLTLVSESEYDAGEIDNTDGEHWKYTTLIADLPDMVDVTVPPGSNPYELGEYKWVDADELQLLDDQGSLHAAMSNGKFATLLGWQEGEAAPMEDATLAPVNLADPQYDMTGWKKISNAGGSNGAALYQDANGNRFYAKKAKSDAHAQNEILASVLYERMGIPSSQARLGTMNGQSFIVSPEVKGDTNGFTKNIGDPEFLKALQDGFAVDAWLGNYDVIGNDSYNVIADENGMPVRIDAGGALMYRGTGSIKSWWGAKPTEIDDMRFGSSKSGSYGNAKSVFGKMSDEQVRDSAAKLLDISNADIQQIVESTGFAPDVQKSLADTLVKRRHAILSQFNISDNTKMKQLDDAHAAQKTMMPAGIPSFNPGQKIKFKDGGATGVVKTVYPDGLVKVKQDGSTDGFATMASWDDIEPAEIADAVVEGGKVHLYTKDGTNFAVGDEVYVTDPTDDTPTWYKAKLLEDAPLKAAFGKTIITYEKEDGEILSAFTDNVITTAAYEALPPAEVYEAPPVSIDDADAAAEWNELVGDFAQPPAGSKLLKKSYSDSQLATRILVEHPDGTYHIYATYHGTGLQNVKPAYIQNPGSYKAEKGWMDFNVTIAESGLAEGVSTPATAQEEAADLPPIFNGNYPTMPEDAEILYEAPDSPLHPYLVSHPDGSEWFYYNDGDKIQHIEGTIDPAEMGWPPYTGPQTAPNAAPAAGGSTAPYSLPADYGTPPDGSTVLFHNSSVQYGSYIVQEPDGSVYAYEPGGNKQKFADIIKDSLLESLANNDAYDNINETVGNPVTTPATNPNNLGEGYPQPPVGSKLVFEDFEGAYKSKLVQHSDGDYHIYWNDGTSGYYSSELPADFGTPEFNEKSATKWTPYNGDGTVTANPMDADVLPTEIDPNAPLSVEGKPLSVGDTVKIIKYAKKNRPTVGKVVKITPDGAVRVMLMGEDNQPYLDEKGHKVYSIAASKNVRHQTVASVSAADLVQDGLPKGLIFSNPDTSSPLYGTAKPEPPVPPGAQGNSAVSDEWIEKADALYKQRKLDKYPTQEPKSVKESSYWNTYYAKVMQGSESDLQWLLDNDYINQELFNEAKSQQAEYLAKQAELTAAYDKEYEAWSNQFAEWKKAQGGATVVPLAHDDPSVQSWSHSEAYTEMNKQFGNQIISGPASSGAGIQKGGGWQEYLRSIVQTVGLKKEDIAKQPNISEYAMEVWDKLSGLGGLSSNEGVKKPFRAIMTRRFWQFSDPSGQPIKGVGNISSLKGTIQKDFGAMEFTPGSVDDGGKYGYGPGGYDVVVDLVVPAGIKGVWTGNGGWGYSGPNSEMGFIAESGLAMYIWDVEVPGPYLNESGGGGKTFKAKVKASLIPTELYPYMDYFQGNPDSHDVMLPAEAQKIIDQYKMPLGLTEGKTSTNPFENTNDGTVGDN